VLRFYFDPGPVPAPVPGFFLSARELSGTRMAKLSFWRQKSGSDWSAPSFLAPVCRFETYCCAESTHYIF